jgi:hypothetical protein
MLRSVKDVVDAVDNGRVHTQRFFKSLNAVGGDGTWTDWAYASGQPAYDARIGDALTLTPSISTRNDAIWFPDIAAGSERRLLELNIYTAPSGASQTFVETKLYDLVAYYPLIDGDSTDVQEMDNTLSLPRYASGEGIQAVLVNHVAPALSAADFVINYTNSNGVAGRIINGRSTTYGVTKVCYTNNATANAGPLYMTLANGDRGVRSIENIQFSTPPGGLFAIYLVKPVASLGNRHGLPTGTADRVVTETNFLTQGGWKMPQILDGASLGFFFMTSPSGARTISIFGNATFIWG